MSKKLIGVIAILFAIAALLFWMNTPEPTPTERLEDAAIKARDALKDAGDAISDSAQQTGEDWARRAQDAAAAFSEMASDKTEDLSAEAAQLIEAWNSTNIVSEDGVNLDNAIAAVEGSQLNGETRDKIIMLLQQIKDAPDQFDAKIQEIKEILHSNS